MKINLYLDKVKKVYKLETYFLLQTNV